MRTKTAFLIVLSLAAVLATASASQEEDWVERSDRNSQVLLEVMARFNPEGVGFLGIDGLENDILQLSIDRENLQIEAYETAIIELRARLDEETNSRVRLDLEILIDSAELNIRGIRLNRDHLVPYFNVPGVIFRGARSLLDDQASPEQRAAVAVRLKRYAGLEDGFAPIFEQAESLIKTRLDSPDLVGPYIGELENDLTNAQRYLAGIRELVASFGIPDCDTALDTLNAQLTDYNDFLSVEVLPRARTDFRLPPAIYALLLENMGVDMPVAELSSRAHVAFREIQNEMQVIASLIAEKQKLDSDDYRDVIRLLKRDQLEGEEILTAYTDRIEGLERIIEEQSVVSLPHRKMRIRLASEAESAAIPSPFMLPPRLIGNTGEMGEFVLPYRTTNDENSDPDRVDDYTFDAASWTLAVHEGRPGHELQYTAMIENGVSLARSLFAFNYVNVEGWALYCEAEMKPTFPLEGQLISLQQRLLRAARAFLDPGMQSGRISREEALRLLEEDVALSRALAEQDIDRYTFDDPAQATSYFCGYLRLMELRAETERKMGDRFNRTEFHDFILSQGLLPPRLLREAVMEGFVGDHENSAPPSKRNVPAAS